MPEHFTAWIQNRSRFESGDPAGVWLDLPATTEQLKEALRTLDIKTPQDLRLFGHFVTDSRKVDIPLPLLQEPDFDTLNFLAARLENLPDDQLEKLNALCQSSHCPQNLKGFLDYPENADCYTHLPDIYNAYDLRAYVPVPSENIRNGEFTNYGYIFASGKAWVKKYEHQEIPEQYRLTPFVEEAPEPLAPPTSDKPPTKVDALMAKLEEGVQGIFESERYRQYLTAMSKFHNYSLNNTLLITLQKPEATLVAGYNAWQKSFGRHVKKGEKAIQILAPVKQTYKVTAPKLDQNGVPVRDERGDIVTQEVERTHLTFRAVNVFDVSQTEGPPLPSLIPDFTETPSPNVLGHPFFKAVEKVAAVPVEIGMPRGSTARGMYSIAENKIYIDHHRSQTMVFKTLIHETAHARLHNANAAKIDRPTAEVEAESVAFAVCSHYGLDTSDYSFAYIAGWSGGKAVPELKSSMGRIRAETTALIEQIDEQYAIEFERYSIEHEPGIEAPEPVTDTPEAIRSQLLERKDILHYGVISARLGTHDEFLAKIDNLSQQIADRAYPVYLTEKEIATLQASGVDDFAEHDWRVLYPSIPEMMNAAAQDMAPYYRAAEDALNSNLDLLGQLKQCKQESAVSLELQSPSHAPALEMEVAR